jgi:hypothetical protein
MLAYFVTFLIPLGNVACFVVREVVDEYLAQTGMVRVY